jgi:hypothetical protein
MNTMNEYKGRPSYRNPTNTTKYHFNGETFYHFTDLLNAYHAAKGYYPIGAFQQTRQDLYYK